MIHFAYTTLLRVLAPLILAYHWYRSISRGRRAALPERLGFLRDAEVETLSGADVIWVHAVSVGETIAVTPLLKELKSRWPHRKIVLSNTTETGREVAGKIKEIDCRIYFPFDYPSASFRLLQKIRPSIIIVVETEIWPNFIRTARKIGIPVVMVNGRISDRSFHRYLRLGWFFKPVLRDITRFCMQTAEDARRIAAIGADPAKVHVTRNLKYDLPLKPVPKEEREERRSRFLIPTEIRLFTAGSTHAGEEEAIISVYRHLQQQNISSFLVLVPRHPERALEVGALLAAAGIPFTLRSALETRKSSFAEGEVLLVDRIGELNSIYSFSDVVFVGGSLVPTGGHNVLEPAAFGAPVVFGPHMANFREIAALVLQYRAGVQVTDAVELQRVVELLVRDRQKCRELGAAGLRMLEDCRGATEAHMEIIASIMAGGEK